MYEFDDGVAWKDFWDYENDHLGEMATLRKSRSGLPVNLYLDDSQSYKKGGHWKRIKFQADKGNSPNTRDMIPMSIEDEPRIMAGASRVNLSSSDIEKVRDFVKANKDLLLKLADFEIDFPEFVQKMKKGGKR